jgi:signal peptide peptidase SppA
MMEAAAFDRVAAFFDTRNSENFQMALDNKAKNSERQLTYNSDTKVGIVELQGPLTYLHYQPMCGEAPTSYQSLLADFETLLEQGAKTIVLDTDSPGGEAYAVFETAKRLRSMADAHGAKIITYVDGMAASAAYALSSISDEIVMNPSAEVGSIGVVVRLRNANKAMKNMGVEDTYVYAGKSKIPFNSDGEFAEEFLEDLQEKVNMLYGDFVSHVAQMRGMDAERVKNTEAKTFLADKAIQLGLADKVMEVEEFYSYLSTVASVETDSKMLTARFLKSNKEDTAKMQELVELQAAHATLTAEFADVSAQLTAAIEAKTSLEVELTKAKETLAQIEADAEQARLDAELAAAQAKADARKGKLLSVVSAEEAEALMASLETLEDAAFETVVASLDKKAKALENSELFTELGVAEQGDEDSLSDTAKILKAKYNK